MFSTAEAILCGNYTPLGQVQIGPIDSLGGQLAEYQIPSGLISTLKLADLAVTVDKLAASSVINSKVAGDAGIIESKLSLDVGTSVLDALISANDIDIASNLALILLREESANKDQASGYLGLDASAKVPLSKLNPLTNSEIAVAAAIIESKLNLDFSTSDLDADIQTRLLAATYLAHDHSLADPTQVDHANLLNVLANQHHAQSHTLASHSTKAHAELTDVTTSQHHVKTVSSEISLASLLEKNHASLASVTSDQHHPQSHTLASHSSKAHSELTGVTADQHHAQAHTLASHSSKAHNELTGVVYNQHHTQKVGPTFQPFVENDAYWSVMGTQEILRLPAADIDCGFRCSFRVPDEWPTGACDLKIMYVMPSTGAYSVMWSVSAMNEGDNRIAQNKNVLDTSTAYDFPAGTANTVYVKTIALSDADIVSGCSLGVEMASDASNPNDLFIMEMWIEPS